MQEKGEQSLEGICETLVANLSLSRTCHALLRIMHAVEFVALISESPRLGIDMLTFLPLYLAITRERQQICGYTTYLITTTYKQNCPEAQRLI